MKRGSWVPLAALLAGAGLFCCGGGGSTPAPDGLPSWSTPERISDNVTELHYPAVALDNQGNAVAAWARGPVGVIYSNRLSAAQDRWEGQVPIGSDSDGGAFEPDLSVDAFGRVVAVWYQVESSVNFVYSRRYAPGAGWNGAPLPVDTAPETPFPQVSLDASGNGFGIWERGGAVLASRYNGSAGSWGGAVPLSGTVPGDAGLPGMPGRGNCIEVDGTGKAHAVWMQTDAGGTHILASRFDGADWGPPARLDPDPGDSRDPALAVNAAGDAAVAWSQAGGNGDRFLLWVRRYRAAAPAGWAPPTLLDNVAGGADKPQIGMDRDGNLVAVWRRQELPSGPFLMYGANFTPADGWSAPARLSATDADGEIWPALAMGPGGKALVAWEQPEVSGGPSRIWAAVFANGAGWGEAVPVSLAGPGDADEPALAVDGSGKAVLVWKQKDDPGSSVQSLRASRLR